MDNCFLTIKYGNGWRLTDIVIKAKAHFLLKKCELKKQINKQTLSSYKRKNNIEKKQF